MKKISILGLVIALSFMGFAYGQDQKKPDAKDGQQQRRPQQNNNDQRRRGGGRGGWGDPAQMQKMINQRMLERYKGQMDVTDEEWTKLEPLIQDVMDKQTAAGQGAGGMMSRMFRGGRGGGQQPQQQPKEGEEKKIDYRAELEKALEENSPDPTIKEKMKDLREDVKKNEKALKDSRDKLRLEVTTKQEAQLILMGILD